MNIHFQLKGLKLSQQITKTTESLLNLPGVTAVHFDTEMERVYIQSNSTTTLEDIVRKLIELGYMQANDATSTQ